MSETQAMVTCAEGQIGDRYVHGTQGPDTFDCSGLVQFCYRTATGSAISASSWEQAKLGKRVAIEDRRPGDILVYGNGAHVGIVTGKNRAVHALNEDMGVRETRIDGANLGLPLTGVRRLEMSGGIDAPVVVPPVTPLVSAITEGTNFRQTGNTDRETFRTLLARRVDVDSPMLPEADVVYDVLLPVGLSRLGAFMAWHERKNDTHIGSYSYYGPDLHNAWAMKAPGGGWQRYPNYRNAAADWAARLLDPAGPYANAQSIREFISTYAPPFENDTEAYIRSAVNSINAMPLVTGEPPTPAPWSPIIYDLANDSHAQRFGLSPAERNIILNKNGGSRTATSIQAIQLHVQWGNTPGSLRHWLGVNASATIMVQRDGSILRVIPELKVPWTGGDVKSPDAQARALFDRFGWDPNQYSLTIEAEDERTLDITAAQLRTIVWQIRQWAAKYPNLADSGEELIARILAHYQINAVDKRDCGLYKPKVVSELRTSSPIPDPEPEVPGLPAWLPMDAFVQAFPLADVTGKGVVTKAVLAWMTAHGELPWFVEKLDLGSGRNVWRFDRVTLFNDGAKVWVEGVPPA